MNIVDTIKSWVNMCVEYLDPNPLLQAGVIIVLATLLAWVLTTILRRVIGRFTKFSKTDFDDRLIGMLNRPVFMTIFLIGAALALALVFGVVRPMLKGVMTGGTGSGGDFVGGGALTAAAGGPQLAGAAASIAPPKYEEKVAAAKNLSGHDPARVAQVVKQWVNAGE